MCDQEKVSFEEIFRQNEKRIHYHIHKLRIQDPHNEFYTEGLYALWTAYKKYEPDKGPLSTYFNYIIRNRLIDFLRKKTTEARHDEAFKNEEFIKKSNGNYFGSDKLTLVEQEGINIQDEAIWNEVRALLTNNQWKWVQGYVIEEKSLAEIAEIEGVSVEAVKSWAKSARRKLRTAKWGQ